MQTSNCFIEILLPTEEQLFINKDYVLWQQIKRGFPSITHRFKRENMRVLGIL